MSAKALCTAIAIAALMLVTVGAAQAQTSTDPFMAETKSLTTTEVTFTNMVIDGELDTMEWAVTDSGHPGGSANLEITKITTLDASGVPTSHVAKPGSPLTVMSAIDSSNTFTKFVITHDDLSSTSATPTVTYTRTVGNNDNLQTTDSNDVSEFLDLPDHMATATDGVAPVISSAEFDSTTQIRVTLSEHLTPIGVPASTIEGYTYSVTASSSSVNLATATSTVKPVTYEEQSSTSTILLTLESAATAGVEHTIVLPENLKDDSGNAFADASARTETATYTAVAPFEAETQSKVTTVVTFDGGSLAGTLDVGNWHVTDNDGGNVDLDVTAIAALGPNGNPVPTTRATDGSTTTIAASSTYTKLLLTHDELSSSGDTPLVEYTRGNLVEGGTTVEAGSDEASDGAPPEVASITLAADGTLRIMFEEGLDQDQLDRTERYETTHPHPVLENTFDTYSVTRELFTSMSQLGPNERAEHNQISYGPITGSTLQLRVGNPPIADGTYYIELGGLEDTHGNAREGGRHPVVYDTTPPTFTARFPTLDEDALVGVVTEDDMALHHVLVAVMSEAMDAADFAAAGVAGQWSLTRVGETPPPARDGDGNVIRQNPAPVADFPVDRAARAAAADGAPDRVVVRASATPSDFAALVATAGSPLTLTYTAGTAPLTDANGVEMASPTSATVAEAAAPTIESARTKAPAGGHGLVTVTLSAAVTGTTAAADWALTLGTEDVPVKGVAAGDRSSVTADPAENRRTPVSLSTQDTLTLAYDLTGDGGNTPKVTYSTSKESSERLAAGGLKLEADPTGVVAADGVAPSFTAEVTKTAGGRITEVTVTFSEALDQAGGQYTPVGEDDPKDKELPEAGDWTLVGSRVVTARTVTYDLEANTATLTLSSADRLRALETVTLDVPADGEAARQDTLVDGGGNALADGTSYTVIDRVAPEMIDAVLASDTEVILTFSEAVRLNGVFNAGDWDLRPLVPFFSSAVAVGEEVRLTMSPTIDTGLSTLVNEAGDPLEMFTYRGDGTVTDASGNELATDAAIRIHDFAAPLAKTARFVGADTIEVLFSEGLSAAPASAFSLRNADDAVVARIVGEPALGTPPVGPMTPNSLVTLEIAPVAVAPETVAPAILPDAEYFLHTTRDIRDASANENRHDPRGTGDPLPVRLAIPPTFTAAFTAANVITLTASEALARATVVDPDAFVVYAPDGTNTRDDGDDERDEIRLRAGGAFEYTAGETEVTITLHDFAKAGVTYTVAPATRVSSPPSSTPVTDADGTPYAGGELTVDPFEEPFDAETRSRTETVLTFDGGALSGKLLSSTWSVREDGAARAVSSVAPLGTDGNPVAEDTATVTTDSDGGVTLDAADGYTSLLLTHARLDSTAATPTVEHVNAADVLEGGSAVFIGVPVTSADRIPPEVVSLGFPPASPAPGSHTHTWVVFSEDMMHPDILTKQHLYTAPTGGSFVYEQGASGFYAYGQECMECALGTQFYSSPGVVLDDGPPDGIYYIALAPLTDKAGNALDAASSTTIGEETRWRIVLDTTAPTIQSAAFTGNRAFTVTFDDVLDASHPLVGTLFTLTAPDGEDADTERDPVTLDATTPVEYGLGLTPRSITLRLAADATPDARYELALAPDAVRNEVGLPLAAGATAAATYAPIFSAVALDGDTTLVTFTGAVTGATAAADWSVGDRAPGSEPVDRAVSSVSARDGGRVVELTHAALGSGLLPPVVTLTVPAGLTVGGAALAAGGEWEVTAEFGAPFAAETRSRTETVLTFDGGALSGDLSTDQWQVTEGDAGRAIVSVAPLDPSGDPVAASTVYPAGSGRPDSVRLAASDGYTRLLVTHERLDSTAARPTVVQRTHTNLLEGGLYVFFDVTVTSADRIAPEVDRYRRFNPATDGTAQNEHLVIYFSETISASTIRHAYPHLYSHPEDGSRRTPLGDLRLREFYSYRFTTLSDSCHHCAMIIGYVGGLPDGIHYIPTSPYADVHGNLLDPVPSRLHDQYSRSRIVIDGTAPVAESAAFADSLTLVVTFDDHLRTTDALDASGFVVTAPGGARAALASADPVAYGPGGRDVTLRLAALPAEGVEYTVAPAAGAVTNEVGLAAAAAGTATATYAAPFSVVSILPGFLTITFDGDVSATLDRADWRVEPSERRGEPGQVISGFTTTYDGFGSPTYDLSGSVIGLQHVEHRRANVVPTLVYTAPAAGGLTIGDTTLEAGSTWHAAAELGPPFASTTTSRTTTLLTFVFPNYELHGKHYLSDWRMRDGSTDVSITSVVPLNAHGNPVPAHGVSTSAPTSPDISIGGNYNRMLVTHEPLARTDATPAVTFHGNELRHSYSRLYTNVDSVAEDRSPPVVDSWRRGLPDPTVSVGDSYLVVYFSEPIADASQALRPDLYSHPTEGDATTALGEVRVREARDYTFVDNGDCADCALAIRYDGDFSDGIYYIPTASFADESGNTVGTASSRTRIAIDATAPVVESAAFAGSRALVVTFDDHLRTTDALAASDFVVTAPGRLLEATASVAYGPGERDVTITLASYASEGAAHTVTLATGAVTNEVGLDLAAGATAEATYTAPFSVVSILPGFLTITFDGDVSATLDRADWRVEPSERRGEPGQIIDGFFPADSTDPPAATYAFTGTVVGLQHVEHRRANVVPTLVYTAPAAGGLTIGATTLEAGSTWHAAAELGPPFASTTTSRTTTLLTFVFPSFELHGKHYLDNWRMRNGDDAVSITSVVPLNAHGNPVPAHGVSTSAPTSPDISIGGNYNRMLVTHEPLARTDATPVVTFHGNELRHSYSQLYTNVDSVAEDRSPPLIDSYRRGVPDPTVSVGDSYLVIFFSEPISASSQSSTVPHLYSHRTEGDPTTPLGDVRVRDARDVAFADSGNCTDCALAIRYDSDFPDGIYYIPTASFADEAGNLLGPRPAPGTEAARSRIAIDATAPTVESAAFTGSRTLVVTFDDHLRTMGALDASDFVVTAQGSVALDATTPVAYGPGDNEVTITLASYASEAAAHTVALAAGAVANEVGLELAAGATAEATYTAPFSAVAVIRGFTDITFSGHVSATLSRGDWALEEPSLPITGISAPEYNNIPEPTYTINGRAFDMEHGSFRGNDAPVLVYTVPAAGLTVGDRALAPGSTWHTQLALGSPYSAATTSRTTTLLTFVFPSFELEGRHSLSDWRMRDGSTDVAITTVVPLDPFGAPVPSHGVSASTPTSESFDLNSDHTQILVVHEPLARTDATPVVTFHGTGLTHTGIEMFTGVESPAEDRSRPVIDSWRRGLPDPAVNVGNDHLVIFFSEPIAEASQSSAVPHLYSHRTQGDPTTPLGDVRVRDARDVAFADSGNCTDCALAIRYDSTFPDGIYYVPTASFADEAGNLVGPRPAPGTEAARSRIVLDTTAPILESAAFAGARTIRVNFDDGLRTDPPLTAANFAVTAPAGTVALAATNPVTYDLESLTLTLTLAEDATDGVEYTITPSSIVNESGIPYPGGSTTATYAPIFTAVAVDGDTTLVRFTGAAVGTTAAADWAVAERVPGSPNVARAVSAAVPTTDGRIVELTHEALGSGLLPPVVTLTVPASGLTVGGAALAVGGEWEATAVFGVPFDAETRSRTETVVIFDGGALSGDLTTGHWRVTEGEAERAIVSVAPLDSSGDPVAASTVYPTDSGQLAFAQMAESDGYTRLLLTHETLSSTAATPEVVQRTHTNLREGGLYVFLEAPATSADRMPPELTAYARTAHANPHHLYVTFSEDVTIPGALGDLNLYAQAVGGSPTFTQTSRAVLPRHTSTCDACVIGISYSGFSGTEGVYYIDLSSITDAVGNALVPGAAAVDQESRTRMAFDDSAPVVTSAAFTGSRTLDLVFDDALLTEAAAPTADWSFSTQTFFATIAPRAGVPLSAASFTVTAPDDTVRPADADSAPDAVPLAAENAVSYDPATRTVSLSLAANAVADTTYTVATTAANEAFQPHEAASPRVTYTPVFTAVTTDGDTTLVTFSSPVTATISASDWAGSYQPRAEPGQPRPAAVNLDITGVSAPGEAGAQTHALAGATAFELSHGILTEDSTPPTLRLTIPAGGLTVGNMSLPAGVVWEGTAEYGAPFAAATQSRTTTLVTFDGGTLSGNINTGSWLVREGTDERRVLSVAALDSTGAPVAEHTATSSIESPTAPFLPVTTSYTQLLITHEPLSSTAAEPVVTHRYGSALKEGQTFVFVGVPATAVDRAPPELTFARHAVPGDRVIPQLGNPILVGFSENMLSPGLSYQDLYYGPTGDNLAVAAQGRMSHADYGGEDCYTCVVAIGYSSRIPEGTYYIPVTPFTDANGNAVEESPSNERGQEHRMRLALDRSPPTVGLVEFTDSRTIRVDFGDPLDNEPPLGAANVAVTVPDGATGLTDANSDPDAVALDATSPVTYDAASMSLSVRLAAGAAPGVAYTLEFSSVRNEAGLALAEPRWQATYTPLFTTTLVSQTVTLATFRAPVTGTFSVSDWAVKDTDAAMTARAVTGLGEEAGTPRAAHTLNRETVIEIQHASLATGESMPMVTYTVPEGGLLVGGESLPAGGTWITTAFTAANAQALGVRSAVFTSQNTITVTFDRPVEIVDPIGWTVDGAPAEARPGAAAVINLVNLPPAEEGAAHTVEIARSAVRSLHEPHLRLTQDTSIPGVTWFDPTTFQLRTERIDGAVYIRAEFNGDAAGVTTPREWGVTISANFEPSPGQQLYTLCGGVLMAVSSIDASDICGDGSSNAFYIPYAEDAFRRAPTPLVRYVASGEPGTTALTVDGQPIADTLVRAVDGVPPQVTLAQTGRGLAGLPSDIPPEIVATATDSTNWLVASFDERVRGTPDPSRWYHYAAGSDLASAVTAGSNFAYAALIDSGLRILLVLPSSHAPESGWGSADTSATPRGIGYSLPAGVAAGLTDSAGTPMASGTTHNMVTDGAPPGITSYSITVLDGTSGSAKTGAFSHVANVGDEVTVAASFTEALSTGALPTLQMFGTTLTLAAPTGMGVSGTIAVPDTHTADGPIDFVLGVTDANGNAASFTRASAAAPSTLPRVDVNDPALLNIFPVSPSRLQLTFSEEVTGMGMVTAASGATVAESDPSSDLVFSGSMANTVVTADFSLSMGQYTFHFDSTVTDLGGRVIPPVEFFVPGPPPPREELVTDRYVPAPAPPPDRMAEERPFDRMIRVPPPPPDLPQESPFRLLTDALEGEPIGSTLTIVAESNALEIPEGTTVEDFGSNDEGETPGTIFMELARRTAETEYVGMPVPDPAQRLANQQAADAAGAPEILVTLGKRNDQQPLVFDQPVKVTLYGAAQALHVFYTSSSQPNPQAPPTREVSAIPLCRALDYGGSATEAPDFPLPVPPVRNMDGTVRVPASGLLDCHEISGADIIIWTNHFTQFGAAGLRAATGGGDGCDDCTPPTLGVDSTGQRRVSGGFTYNGDTVNAEYYYTPLPLITVETGEENVAMLKIFEDTGARSVRHAGLSFGLSNGQHFAEAEAAIRVDMAFNGDVTVSLDDPQNAIDADSLRAEVGTAACMAGSEAECRTVKIHHTFREPLDFNVVSTIVWDDRRNSWQNFFNHGVHVTGDSLNPRHGVEVNGGELVLYPLIAGSVDADADGVYDYDERHVTYMLDDEYRVYRLAPDGTYKPLRNLASLHHEVDETMWDESLPKKFGPSRASELFAELVAEERRIASELLDAMGIPQAGGAAPVVSHDYDRELVEARAEELQLAIADEVNAAELAMQKLYPEMYVVE